MDNEWSNLCSADKRRCKTMWFDNNKIYMIYGIMVILFNNNHQTKIKYSLQIILLLF
jgi:hypothetical protein